MKRQLSAFFDLGFRPERDAAPTSHARDFAPDADADDFATLAFRILAPQSSFVGSRKRGPGPATRIVVFVVVVAAMGWFVVRPPTAAALTAYPVVTGILLLVVGAFVLGALATLVHFLRRQRNPLYWQLACWLLVVLGIVVRQMVASGSPSVAPWLFGTSAAVGIAILPVSMRWINRIATKPGLQHVAVPFSLGFFLDLAQVLTSHYIVPLPWVPK